MPQDSPALDAILASAASRLRQDALEQGQDAETIQRYLDLYQVRFAQLLIEFQRVIEAQGKTFVLHEAVKFLNTVFLEMIVQDTEWMRAHPLNDEKLH